MPSSNATEVVLTYGGRACFRSTQIFYSGKNGAEHFSVSGRQLAALSFNSKLLDPVGVVAAHLP